jgi:hypothetical protein
MLYGYPANAAADGGICCGFGLGECLGRELEDGVIDFAIGVLDFSG